MIFIGWDEMRNSIYVMGKDIPVSWIPLIPRMSGPDIRGISVYVKSTYTENSWALPWSGQQIVTRVETLIFSKYLVGSRANPWHDHVVGKSLRWTRICMAPWCHEHSWAQMSGHEHSWVVIGNHDQSNALMRMVQRHSQHSWALKSTPGNMAT